MEVVSSFIEWTTPWTIDFIAVKHLKERSKVQFQIFTQPYSIKCRKTRIVTKCITKHTEQFVDVDDILKDCEMVTPVEAPNLEIDLPDDDDEEFRPMRVSSKGKLISNPVFFIMFNAARGSDSCL